MQGPVHPQVRSFANGIRSWGKLKLALVCQLLLLLLTSLTCASVNLVLYNSIVWQQVQAVFGITLLLGPAFIAIVF